MRSRCRSPPCRPGSRPPRGGRLLALLAAVLAVGVPSLAYTATIVTENLFYPVALVVAWALVLVLERPAWPRAALLALVLVAAVATRSQALGFVAAACSRRSCWRSSRGTGGCSARLSRSSAGSSALCVVVLGGQLARGRSLSDLLGAYSVVGEGGYDVGEVMRFWLWHIEELTLYVAVDPCRADRRRRSSGPQPGARAPRALAATLALVATTTLVVAAFASRFASDRVQDRYLFFLAPLLVIVLLGWVELGAPRPVLALVVGRSLAVGLVTAFPYTGSSPSRRSRTRSA